MVVFKLTDFFVGLCMVFATGQAFSQREKAEPSEIVDCENEKEKSCLEKGYVHLWNDDIESGIKYFKKLCELEKPNTCSIYGALIGLTQPAKSLEALSKACKIGEAPACLSLAKAYKDAGKKDKSGESFKSFFSQKKSECKLDLKSENCEFFEPYFAADAPKVVASQEAILAKLGGGASFESIKKLSQQDVEALKIDCHDAKGQQCRQVGYLAIAQKNLHEAMSFFELGCKFFDGPSCVKIGVYLQETGRKGSALNYFKKATLFYAEAGCKEGRVTDCTKLKKMKQSKD